MKKGIVLGLSDIGVGVLLFFIGFRDGCVIVGFVCFLVFIGMRSFMYLR